MQAIIPTPSNLFAYKHRNVSIKRSKRGLYTQQYAKLMGNPAPLSAAGVTF